MNEKYVSHPFMTMIWTSVTMVGWADVPDSDQGDFRRRRAADIYSLLMLIIKFPFIREEQPCRVHVIIDSCYISYDSAIGP